LYRLAVPAFWLIFIGFNLTFFLMHLTGLLGMPRRVYTYPGHEGWIWLNLLSSVGGFIMTIGFGLVVIDLLAQLRYGGRVRRDPWQGATRKCANLSVSAGALDRRLRRRRSTRHRRAFDLSITIRAARAVICRREPQRRQRQYCHRGGRAAPPDGYTLLLITVANAPQRDDVQAQLRLHPRRVMEVHPSVPAKTVPEFIAYAKAKPGKINLASAGTGSLPHVAGEMFAQASRDFFKRLVTMLHLDVRLLLLLRHHASEHRTRHLRVVARHPLEERRQAARRIEVDLAPRRLQRIRLALGDPLADVLDGIEEALLDVAAEFILRPLRAAGAAEAAFLESVSGWPALRSERQARRM
jgi:hypothetical protein